MAMARGLLCLLAGLAGESSAVPLRHATVAEDPLASSGTTRTCNIQASTGMRYLVDNTKLHANTRGLSFRLIKDNQARDVKTVALWGSEVVGTDEGDGWVRVGDCFLPLLIREVPILRPVDPEAQLSLQGVAQVSSTLTEQDHKKALAEATDVAEAAAARLKKNEVQIQELEAINQDLDGQLRTCRSAAAAGSGLASRSRDPEQQTAQMKDMEDEKQRLLEELGEYKEESAIMSKDLQQLRADLKAQRDKNEELKNHVRDIKNQNKELIDKTVMYDNMVERTRGEAFDADAARAYIEEVQSNSKTEQLNQQKHAEEVLVEVLQGAQKNKMKDHEKIVKLKKELKEAVQALAERQLNCLQQNSTANSTAGDVEALQAHVTFSRANAADAAQTAEASVKATTSDAGPARANAATAGGGVAAAVEGSDTPLDEDVISTELESLMARAAATSADALNNRENLSALDQTALRQRLEAKEKRLKELERELDEVKHKSDSNLYMAGNQIQEIKKKMTKNNHSFQVRFEACENRNSKISVECDADKMELKDEIQKLKAGPTAVNGTAEPVNLGLRWEHASVREAGLSEVTAELRAQLAKQEEEANRTSAEAADLRAQLVKQEEEANRTSAGVDRATTERAARLQHCQDRVHRAEEVSKALQTRLDTLQSAATRSAASGVVALLLAWHLAA